MAAEKTRVIRRNGRITSLVIGRPLRQRIDVPRRYQAAVTRLFDHPAANRLEIGRYLRYHLLTKQGWHIGIGDAEGILSGSYPWDQYGFSTDDEGNQEGPDCLIIDHDWNLLDARGRPTLDLMARIENWSHEDAFDDNAPRLKNRNMEIRITVLADSRQSLMKKLKGVEPGWNLCQSVTKARPNQIQLTHEFYSGRAVLTEPAPGVLLCRIVPTDLRDPERLLALVVGALHRWLQDDAHSMTVDYVRSAGKPSTKTRHSQGRSRRIRR